MSNFIFPYSYQPGKSIEVFEKTKTFIKDNELDQKVSELGRSYHAVGKLIPHHLQNLWSGHFFPYLESWEELQISFNLCLFGFYKQSMFSIRSASELGLLSVYWNLNDEGHDVIQTWLSSQEETPKLNDIWGKLIKHPNFKAFADKYDLKSELLELNYLHDWVHSKGFQYSNKIGQSTKPNFQSFEKEGFELWLESYEEVIRILSICHLIKYPLGTVKYDWSQKFGIDVPSFGGLNELQVDRLKSLVGEEVFKILKNIAEDDEHVQKTLEEIKSMDDMTDEDLSQQIIDFEKMMIKQNGLENWLEEQERLIGPVEEMSRDYKERVEKLTKWAKEMGFEKSIFERKGVKGPPST